MAPPTAADSDSESDGTVTESGGGVTVRVRQGLSGGLGLSVQLFPPLRGSTAGLNAVGATVIKLTAGAPGRTPLDGAADPAARRASFESSS